MGRSVGLLENVPLLRRLALTTLLLVFPGLTQLTAQPALAEPEPPPQPVVPIQMTGTAKGLPAITDARATVAQGHRTAGPKVTPKWPKNASWPDARPLERRLPQKRVTPSKAKGMTASIAVECLHSAWSRFATYAPDDIVSHNGRDWQAVQPSYGVPPSSPRWQDEGPCYVRKNGPNVVDMFPGDGAMVSSLTPLLVAHATPRSSSGDVRYSFEICREFEPEEGGIPFPIPIEEGWCWNSDPQPAGVNTFRVPSGRLKWGKNYTWSFTAVDVSNNSESTSETFSFTTGVRQHGLTSQLTARGANGQEFHQLAGNYTTAFVDATVKTVGLQLNVTRSYNSQDPRTTGMFGAGWSTRFDMRIEPEEFHGVTALLVTYPDGRRLRFAPSGDGTFQAPPGMHATLAEVSGGGWRLMDQSSTTYTFDSAGRLDKISDSRGRGQNLHYGSDGKLSKVTAAGGRSLTFAWTGNQVTTVTTDPVDGSALTWTYHYDSGRLIRACAPVATPNCTTYAYGSGSQYQSVIQDADPAGYWRFGEPQSTPRPTPTPDPICEWFPPACADPETTTAASLGWAAGSATYQGVVLGQPGALAGTGNGAATFSSAGSEVKLPSHAVPRLGDDLAVEAWFRTASSGIILSIHSAESVLGFRVTVPVLYVGTDGRLRGRFGGSGGVSPVTSATSVNDNQWHHVVLSASGQTQTLYLEVASEMRCKRERA